MYRQLYDKLKPYNQEHLLKYWDELAPEQQDELAAEINNIKWDYLTGLIPDYVLNKPETHIPDDLSPAPYFPAVPEDSAQKELYAKASAKGVELIKAGKVAALTVAGGQGSRLGFDGPKGTYPITPLKQKTLFQYFAESILRINEKYGITLNWYLMTSKLNNQQTKDFFVENNYFGLKPESVIFFVQGTMPAIGYDGKLLLQDKGELALAPDGHGGTMLALKNSGALDKMAQAGVEYISYYQVDNPLISIVNPLFIGLHCLEQAQMSAIMLAKTGPEEKLGNFCMSKGRLMIIEYSDMPEKLSHAVDANGKLRFIAGSPAIHVISRSFIEELTADGVLNLPWHRADKKVPCLDAQGNEISPESPNAVKLESFIFDALPLADKTMILEAVREEEFAPTKNKTGVDSVESCRQMLIDRDRKRLERAGVKVADGLQVEISPRFIVDDEDAIEYCRTNGIVELTDSVEGIYVQ